MEKPPTRSPTWWSVTSGPDRGDHTGEVDAQLRRPPSKVGYRPIATSTSAKLMLDAVTATSIWPGPGGTRSNGDEFHRLQVAGRADLQAHAVVLAWSTTVVCRSSGRSGLGRSRAVYQSPSRQAVSSSSEPLSSCWAT